MSEYLLAHDLGTSGNKATLFDTDGNLIKSTVAPYKLYTAAGGCAEQNPEDWWAAVCSSTKELLEGIDKSKVAAVSFSGQMMGCVCVDGSGKVLRNALIWADMRSVEQEKQIRAKISETDFYRITGHKISSSYSATKLMWVRDNEPELYKKTYKMLNAKDYMILKLTGNYVTEPSDASSTCLLDLQTLRWSDTLLDICKISSDKMPDILRSIDICGRVTHEASLECGLLEGTAVVCGGGDGVCAAVGTGIVKEGVANCCLGTSSWISFASKKPVYDPKMSTFNFAHIVPDMVMPCGTMQSGAGSMSWAADCFCKSPITKNPSRSTGELYDEICAAVENSPVGARGLIFLPYLMGERSPRWNPRARGSFIGLTSEHELGDIFRAVMEGVGMNLSLILDAFQNQNAVIRSLVLVGGGARNIIWRQILSDILGVPISVPDCLEEATSMGAAITAGVGVGAFEDFLVIDRFLKNKTEYAPNRERDAIYSSAKQAFDMSYESLVPAFDILHDISLKKI